MLFPHLWKGDQLSQKRVKLALPGIEYKLTLQDQQKKQHPFPFPIQPANFMHLSMSSPRYTPGGRKGGFPGCRGQIRMHFISPYPLLHLGLNTDRHIMALYDQNGQNRKRNLNGNHVQKSDAVIPFQSGYDSEKQHCC